MGDLPDNLGELHGVPEQSCQVLEQPREHQR